MKKLTDPEYGWEVVEPEDDKLITKLLNQKRKLENSFERKQRIWEKTLREHIELEKVEVKLRELN